MNSITKKIISVVLAAGMTLSVFSIGAGAVEPLPAAAVVEEMTIESDMIPVVKADAKTAEKAEEAESAEQESTTPNYLKKIIDTIKDLVAIIKAALVFLDKVKAK